MKTTIMGLCMGRNELTFSTWTENLKRAGAEYDLFITDQGEAHKNNEWTDQLNSLKPKYLRANLGNEGISRSLNQMMIRNINPLYFFMPPDILLPENWLQSFVDHALSIPNAGIVGFLGQGLKLPKHEIEGRVIYSNTHTNDLENSQVLGAVGWSYKVVNKIGFFCEDYHPYGWEDADYCFRAHLAGFNNFLIDKHSQDLGNDYHEKSFYSELKKFMSLSNVGLHRWRHQNYHIIGLFEKPPIARGPMF